VERGVPYALLSDAFLPLLRGMDPTTLAVLSRGGEEELRYLFPALSPRRGHAAPVAAGDPEEFRTRLLWNFTEFLKSHAARTPLLVILEDLHWADASSLELVHFLARQTVGQPILILGTYTDSERDRSHKLLQLEMSLLGLGIAKGIHLDPLSETQVLALLSSVFGVDAKVVGRFAAMLFRWTRGNPFFVEEILQSLVATGKLHLRNGTWLGWDASDFALPGSIRDAVAAGLHSQTDDVRATAELAAVVGNRASHPLLASISDLPQDRLLRALEQLCEQGFLDEQADGDTVVYDFRHPVVRETLYQGLGLQRTRILHGLVAEAMEAYWGDTALQHADELAYHFTRTDGSHRTAKTVTYLAEAGRRALDRHADQEAADYLLGALGRLLEGEGAHDVGSRAPVLRDLARAHQRLGAYGAAFQTWDALLEVSPRDGPEEVEILRALGLCAFWSGHRTEAFGYFARGLEVATTAELAAERVSLLLARSHCYQELGAGAHSGTDAHAALAQAEKLGDASLMARARRSLALLHVWIGPPAVAEDHARRAIELAVASGDTAVEFWAHWGLAVLWGMTGDTRAMAQGIEEARRLADRLRSPVLKLWTTELSIELSYATGDWDVGIALGEQSVALARNLNQKALLPRLLVWTSLFYVGRGNLDMARALVDEACAVSGMHEPGPHDVHLVVPAYTGMAHYLVGLGEYSAAIEAARKGLQIAEGTGYTLWAVHRLLPILAEACLWADEIDQAELLGMRLREHAQDMDHKLGMAWADACDALVTWKRGDASRGAEAMRRAAEALEEIPMIPYSVRVRRQLAGRLVEIGDTEGALRELRIAHDIFARLGAELELEKARIQFREIGQRPPPRGTGEGVAGLTPRELEIARLVALRRSNKAIGKELGISPRTVSTHLSNVFQKLEIASRAELGDVIRDHGLLQR
jgi:DNA-binding NarL/FixJ family response regulator